MTSPRRSAILDAALTVFLEHGLSGARIEQVAARSGASIGSIYHHFGGKDALGGAVFVAALADYQQTFLAALREHDDAAAGIRAAVRAHLRWCLRDQPDYGRFLLFCGDAARADASADLPERNREFFGDVLAWLRPHVDCGAISDLPITVLYALWLGPAQEYCRLSLTGRSSTDDPDAEQAIADGAWRALRTEESTKDGAS